jgi:SWI/SNF-related matrix-associated actin-dependent regulator 1 of chromatin subfamily A
MVRRLKKDVLTELPAKRRQIVVMENDGFEGILANEGRAERNAAADLERNAELKAAAELAKADGDVEAYKAAVKEMEAGGKVAFEEISRVRHETALAKVEACSAIIAEELETVGKLIVFAHHLDVIAKYMANLADFNPVKITGDDALDARQAAVDRFQNDPACRVIVCSIRAAGVGLTLTAATEVVFAELDWTPGAMSQAEDRAHRIGQTEMVLVKHLVLDGSLDARMAEILVGKQEVIDKAMDAQTRVEASAPVMPTRGGRNVEATVKEYEEAKPVAFETMQAILAGLRILAGVCDGAASWDDAGFNKCDTFIGKRLASLSILTPRQCVLGAKLVNKYRRQLSPDLVAKATGKA